MSSSSGNPSLTVYFRGFPENIANDELEDTFLNYGNVVKFFVHKSRSYGMVEFDTLSSCQEAIRHLSGAPPLNLYLNMVKSGKNNTNTNMNDFKKSGGAKYNAQTVDSMDYDDQEMYVDENFTLVNFLRDPETNEIYVPIRFAPNIRRIIKKVPVVKNGPNENLSDNDDSMSTNTSSSHTRRRVNLDTSLNGSSLRIERSFTENNDSSTVNTVPHKQGFQKQLLNGIGNSGGEMHSNDGFTRKAESTQRPPYGGRTRSGNTEQNMRRHKEGSSSESGDETKPRFNKNKFQGGGGDNQTKFSKREFNKTKSSEKDGDWNNTVSSPAVEKKSLPHFSTSSPIEKKISNTNTTHAPITSRIINRSQFHHNIKPNAEPKKVSYKSVELPKNQFTEVEIVETISETLGWAQISANLQRLTDFMTDVVENQLKAPKSAKPEVGKICLAKYQDIWFRVVILTTSPKIKVRYIDYGNEAEVDEVSELASQYCDVPAFAFCINLSNGTPCKLSEGLLIKVKPVKIDNDVITVQVENGIYDNEPKPEPVSSTSTVVSKAGPKNHSIPSASSVSNSLAGCQKTMLFKLQPGMTAMLEITEKLSSTKAVAFFLPELLTPDATVLENLSKQFENTNSSFKPKVGDLVAAVNDGWNRAIILKIENGFKVAFIDYGTIGTVMEVKPLPDDFKSIPQFSCIFTASENNFSTITEVNTGLNIKITKIINNTVHCSLFGDEYICDITFVLWTPELESSGQKPSGIFSKRSSSSASSLETVILNPEMILIPPELKLSNGDHVKLIDENKNYLFIRTKDAVEILKRVDKYISEYAPKAPKVPEKPFVGQYVAAKFENAWYRAKITNLNPTNAKIVYIDYGNEEVKPFLSLKLLDEYLCKEPCALIKIKLKGFVDKPFTPKCLDFFEKLTVTKHILKASYEGSVENGVDLIMKDGKSVTEELVELNSVPKSRPFQARKELYMKINIPGKDDPRITSSSLKLEEIPFGIGKIRYLGEVDLSIRTISVCVNNPEILHKVHVELLEQMTKYVNNIPPQEPYNPVRDEVVLVENRDKWYRAFCLEHEDGGSIIVFFIDYGFNLTVTADKIRQMPKEFMEYNALANFAVISGLPNTLNENVIDRLKTLLERNEDYNVEVLEKDEEDSYIITFPDITKQLKSENLIK